MYGPADRAEVLTEIGRHLAEAKAGCALWLGDSLLVPAHPGQGLKASH